MSKTSLIDVEELGRVRGTDCGRTIIRNMHWFRGVAAVGLLAIVLGPVARGVEPGNKIRRINPPPKIAGTDVTPPAVPEGPKPVIHCDEPVHDFGTTWVGPPLNHTFILRNLGDVPLQITRVRPACGCTKAGPSPSTIAPGESGSFPFTINSNKVRGRYEKAITITSNDPVHPAFRLKLRGECKRYVDVLPAAANFGKVTTDEPQERVLKITNNTDEPLEVSVSPTEAAPFSFRLVETKPKQEYELRVTMTPPYTVGNKRNTVTLTTNKDAQKTISVTATARVPERLDIIPKVVTVTTTPNAIREFRKPIRFTNYGKDPVKLLDATCDDEKVKLEIRERTEGRAYTVNITAPAGYMPETTRTITLKTDDKEKPTVTIPLRPRRIARRPQRRVGPESLVGKPAPAFAVKTAEGKPLNQQTMEGEVTVLDFFAPNCPHCKRQIPRMEAVRKKYEDKGVRFVAVSQTMHGRTFTDDQVKEILDKIGYTGEVVFDPKNTIGPRYSATGFPTMAIIDKEGKIGAVNVGNMRDLEDRMQKQLDALIAGKPVPKVAAKSPKKRRRPAEGLVGKKAPSFSIKTLQGKPVGDAEFGKVKATVLNFVAPNCGFCKRQVPNVEKVRKEYESKGVRFVNVAQKMRKEYTDEQAEQIFSGIGSNLELATDFTNTVGGLYKAVSFPTMFVVSSEGVIKDVVVGAKPDIDKTLKKNLDELIKQSGS